MADRPVGVRRPHQKTRKGCLQCKEKRVKCDEAKPTCGRCARYASACNFPVVTGRNSVRSHRVGSQSTVTVHTPHSRGIPPPELSNFMSPSALGLISTDLNPQQYMEDLELMHFYTMSTSSSFSSTINRQQIWQEDVPQLAFSQKSLLNALLSLAALQLAELQPHRKDILIAKSLRYHDVALRFFVSEIFNITPENCQACFIFATIFASYAWASSSGGTSTLFLLDSPNSTHDSVSVEWTKLIRGVLPIIRSYGDTLKNGVLKLLFELWPPGVEKTKSMLPEDRSRLLSIAQIWNSNSADYTAGELESLNKALSKLEEIFDFVAPPNDGVCFIMMTFSWLTNVTETYLTMVGNRRPAALVVLAHYCILLGNTENDCWWLRGMGRNLLSRIFKDLSKEWESWMSWPLQDLALREFRSASKATNPLLTASII